MSHMSALGLFDYVAGRADLTTQEAEHLQDCDDCRDEVMELRRVIKDFGDIEKARIYLAQEGKLPADVAGSAQEKHGDEQHRPD
jgi:hypothetical protein